jgi:flagellar hook-associated protein 2
MGVNGIYGLSGSGMDIESLVKVGMMGKQKEYDKMAQKYTKNEWTKTAYLEINNTLTTFKDSTLSQYKMSNNMNAKEASSTNAAVKVSASSSATPMNHTVAVSSLSSNAYLISTAAPENKHLGIADNSDYALGNRLFQEFTVSGDTITGKTLDGKSFTANKTDSAIKFVLKDGTKDGDTENSVTIDIKYEQIANGFSMNDLASKISNSGLNIKASYDTVNDRFSLYNTQGGTENTVSIQITDDAIDKSTGTKAVYTQRDWVYDTPTDPLSVPGGHWGSETTTGEIITQTSYQDVVGSNTANLFNSWKLYQSKDGELYNPGTDDLADGDYWKFNAQEKVTITETKTYRTSSAHDENYVSEYNWYGNNTISTKPVAAVENELTNTDSTTRTETLTGTTSNSLSGTTGKIKVDGVEYTTTDNKVTVNGVTYTALDTTKDSTGAVKNATVSVTQNTEDIIDKVKSFVEDYNKLLSSLYEKYDEKPNSDYKPLTQTQKDAMKEEQIEKWEEKAKKGLLYHDQTLGKIIRNIRSSIVESVEGVEGKYNSAFSIGISTTGIKGQLKLDEDKLRKALSEDSDAVYNVFAKLDGNDLDNQAKSGIAQRLGDILTTANKSIKSRAGSTSDITEDSDLNKLLRNLQTRMSNFKKMMNSFEDALYKKYDAMEAMLAKLGTQLSYIMGSNS